MAYHALAPQHPISFDQALDNLDASRDALEASKLAGRELRRAPERTVAPILPLPREDRSSNPMRPFTFDEIVGQERAVGLLTRVVGSAKTRRIPLDHVLLVGAAGTGKTTVGQVIAHELGVDCYQLGAPVAFDVLMQLRTTMKDRDVLLVDEIHMQAVMERRGKESMSSPEVFLHMLEDRVIVTPTGVLEFPHITVIGMTTDPGRLPDPFLDRFPLQPRLDPYTVPELAVMAVWDVQQIGMSITVEAAGMFARAARETPRMVTRYVQNAASLTTGVIDERLAEEVLYSLNGVTGDGLSPDQQSMLTFLYERGERTSAKGEKTYQASVSTIATGIGLSRDQKAIQLRVEPTLIKRGLVQVGHGGRLLTDAGIARAKQLLR